MRALTDDIWHCSLMYWCCRLLDVVGGPIVLVKTTVDVEGVSDRIEFQVDSASLSSMCAFIPERAQGMLCLISRSHITLLTP